MRIEIVLTDGPPKAVESTQFHARRDEHRSESRQAAPADDRLREWEQHGSHRWGLGVAVDLCDLESRVAALEKNHDAAPAARARADRGRTDKAALRPGEGTGDTQEGAVRIDPDTCRDPDLLAAEVRRLQGVIDADNTTLTGAERVASPASDGLRRRRSSVDIMVRLRAWRDSPHCRALGYGSFGTKAADDIAEAADEIARLRLTDADREAVAWAARRLSDDPMLPRDRSTADTLRGLLEKHKGSER